jgi:hypothetical protein
LLFLAHWLVPVVAACTQKNYKINRAHNISARAFHLELTGSFSARDMVYSMVACLRFKSASVRPILCINSTIARAYFLKYYCFALVDQRRTY